MVDISSFAFVPGDASVPLGMNVTWTNHDPVPHPQPGDLFEHVSFLAFGAILLVDGLG